MSPRARTLPAGAAAILAVAGAAVLLAAGCGGAKETAAADGPTIYADSGCANCHRLDIAGSNGKVGPDLDDSDMTVDQVAAKVRDGGGGMPSFDNLTDEQLQALAEYVVGEPGR